jgi:hypothetical protein
MRLASLLLIFGVSSFAAAPSHVLPTAPVRFERNQGQIQNRGVAWIARGLGYSLAFTDDATVIHLGQQQLSIQLPGQDSTAPFRAASPYSVPTQYFTAAYRGSVQSYRRLRRNDIYPGIDLVYYGNGEHLEYDCAVAPGADPSRIRMHFEGARDIRLDPQGNLVLDLGSSTVTQNAPVVYQAGASGERVPVKAAYRIEPNHDVTFTLGAYDATVPLTIDPVISFAAYLYGSGADTGVSVRHDAQGFVYLAGNTSSNDFGTTANAFYGAYRGGQDVWMMKLNPTAPGDQVIVYSTLFGGTALDSLKDMAVDANGLVYLTGSTTSTDLLTTAGAFQTAPAGATDGFVAMFDPTQSGTPSLVYATYLGGSAVDEPLGVATHGGMIYVTGSTLSDNFPVANAVFPSRNLGRDVFVAELDPSKTGAASLIASTYFGGSGSDYGQSVAVDSAGLAYVVGNTYSPDLPVTGNAYQAAFAGGGEAFLLQLDLNAPQIYYSSYFGGSSLDAAKKVVIDSEGRVALAGYTLSADLPITQDAVQPLLGHAGAANAFLSILDLRISGPQSLVYSTYFGGSVAEVPYDLRLDDKGKYYLGGYSLSKDLPVSQNAIDPVAAPKGGLNGFVAVIDPSAPPFNALVYSSFITGPGSQIVYGVDFDAAGGIYVTGFATGDIFPAGFQGHTSAPGNPDAFLFGFTPDPLPAQ